MVQAEGLSPQGSCLLKNLLPTPLEWLLASLYPPQMLPKAPKSLDIWVSPWGCHNMAAGSPGVRQRDNAEEKSYSLL